MMKSGHVKSQMSPRPYRLGQRQVAVDANRVKMLAAARDLLKKGTSFSIDAVARRAGLTRMTVYHQFGSRRRLLEALFDELAARGGMHALPLAFQQADPMSALDRAIDIFARFWVSDRLVQRRLRAMAALDPELGLTLMQRNEWRRQSLRVILGRLDGAQKVTSRPSADTVDLLFALTSFESFDLLAGPRRSPTAVAPIVKRAAAAIVGGQPR
jgi:AcrR family transcriptional regulator